MANFFSSTAFLDCAKAALFRDQFCSTVTAQTGGYQFAVLRVGRRVRADIPFLDFLEPTASTDPTAKATGFLPAVALDSVCIDDWDPQASQNQDCTPAPWLDWGRFSQWQEFVEYARKRSKRAFKRKGYEARRLEREEGELQFNFHRGDLSLLDLCIQWKSAQYQASGLVDLFAIPGVRELFVQLLRRGHLVISELSAGGTPVALHMGFVWDNIFHYWVPAYDFAKRKHSPGNILLEKMLESSYGQGHRRFHFLLGDSPYKFFYATHVARVRELGQRPLVQRLWQEFRGQAMPFIRRQEWLYSHLQQAKRRFLQRGG